jgi:hypothetical protein
MLGSAVMGSTGPVVFGEPEDNLAKGFKAEMGVQCESCHGPGETHMNVAMGQRDGRRLGWTPFAWLVYLGFFLAPLVVGHPTTREVVGGLAAFCPTSQASARPPARGCYSPGPSGIGLATVPVNQRRVLLRLRTAFLRFVAFPMAARMLA